MIVILAFGNWVLVIFADIG